jgi:hypothetical protein
MVLISSDKGHNSKSLFIYIDRVSQEGTSIFRKVTVSVILSKKLYMYVCPVPDGFRSKAVSLYSSKTVCNAGIYCSSD